MVYKDIGIELPNTAVSQFQKGVKTDIENAQPGDLIFFKRGKRIGHVGIYIGQDLFIHASSSARKVIISSLKDIYFIKHFVGIKKYFSDKSIFVKRQEGENVE